MAKFELNIYGENDEILKTFSTDHIRWGFLTAAIEIQEEIEGSDPKDQFDKIGGFIKELFVGMTDADLSNADYGDVINVFNQITRQAGKIKSSKNA